MAGIKVAQHKIFKISTEHLREKYETQQKKLNKIKYYNEESECNDEVSNTFKGWELTIDKNDAELLGEYIPLFDSQMFRLIDMIIEERHKKDNSDIPFDKTKIDYTQYVFSLIVDKDQTEDFDFVVDNGLIINGKHFVRYVGTTGGLKQNSVLFVSSDIYDELNTRTISRTKNVNMVPAKFEAYKALTCSSSQPIPDPSKIAVVSDVIIKYIDTVVELDDTIETDNGEPNMNVSEMELENNGSDGFNLCTIEYMKKCCEALGIDFVSGGLCLRNKWLKGMMYPFPIKEFVNKYNHGESIIMDIWENPVDLNEVDLILTESSLKLWSSYDSIEDYIKNYKDSGYGFAVTKISSDVLEDSRDLNYQYLQSYDFTDDDIEELCRPTVDFLKGSMGESYEDVINFLGIGDQTNDYGWQHALKVNREMLKDPYIIDNIHRLIKKKIDEAKIGKLTCNANFQIFSGDPICLMEHICGLEVKGLLNAGECYSSYWINKYPDTKEILAFRSPMTCHNNIRKLDIIDNEDTRYWYQYMKNILIVNSFDYFAKSENGEDADGDQNFTTNNKVLLRKYRNEPAISCIQKTAAKTEITEKTLFKSNHMAFGNDVGTITNYVTSMIEVQSRFPKDSKEYEILGYRIQCGQLYQQNCLDAIKGIVAKKMPKYWFKRNQCFLLDSDGKKIKIIKDGEETNEFEKDHFLQSICANKKPYFMIYRYQKEKQKYNQYIDINNIKCMQMFGITLNELLSIDDNELDEQMLNFKKWYYLKIPVGTGECAMNKICWYIENEMEGFKSKLKKGKTFDYSIMQIKMNKTKRVRDAFDIYTPLLSDLCNQYTKRISEFKKGQTESNDKTSAVEMRNELKRWAKEQAAIMCPDEAIRLNIIVELCYGDKKMNKQFCWDTVGKLIIKKLEEENIA